MKTWMRRTWIHKVAMGVFGWLVPGGGYLFERRYLQFGASSALICAAFAAGIVMQGASLWIAPDELTGVDGFTSLVAKMGVVGKALAGAPYLLARVFYHSQNYVNGRLHEYGTILLVFAGLMNLLVLAMHLSFGRRTIMLHPEFTVLLAALLAAIICMTGDRTARERLSHGSYVFLGAMVTVVAGSWIMHVIEM